MESVSTYASGITNKGFLTSRGFEISFKKMFTRMTSFNLSYNLQWVKSFEGGEESREVVLCARCDLGEQR